MFNKKPAIFAHLIFLTFVLTGLNNSVKAQEPYWYGAITTGDASIAEDLYDASTPTAFYLGRRLSERTAFEIGYLDLGGFESDPDDFLITPGDLTANADVTGIEASVLGLAKMGGSVEFFGKAGLYIWEGDEVINGDETDDSDVSLLLGLGIHVPIGTSVGFRSEYVQYYEIGNEDADAIHLGLNVNF